MKLTVERTRKIIDDYDDVVGFEKLKVCHQFSCAIVIISFGCHHFAELSNF